MMNTISKFLSLKLYRDLQDPHNALSDFTARNVKIVIINYNDEAPSSAIEIINDHVIETKVDMVVEETSRYNDNDVLQQWFLLRSSSL